MHGPSRLPPVARDDLAVTEGSLKGRLLVATPSLGDPNFDRTVVLVLEHNEEGALGVVLNRPSDIELAGPLPEWRALAADPPVVFVGGPVAQGAAIGLVQVGADTEGDAWTPVLGPVGILDLSRDPDDVGLPVAAVRIFSGYAGWGPDQLQGEVDVGAWFVVDGLPEDALSPEPGSLWRSVLKRQRGQLALFANFPADPAMN